MILRRPLCYLFIFLSALFLQACGNAADSSDGMGGGGSRPGGGGGGVDTDNGRMVDVIVEGTEGIGGEDSVIARLLNAVLPQQAHALTDQKRLKVKEIRIVKLDQKGEPLPEDPFPSNTYSVKYNNPDGSHRINFSNPYTSALNLAIVAELPNGQILRRPLPSTTRTGSQEPHPINAATEYVIREFFDYVNAPPSSRLAEYNRLLNCLKGDYSCLNEQEMRLLSWLAIFEGAVGFEISFDDELTLNETLAALDSNLAVHRFVHKSFRSLLERKIGGINSGGTIPDAINSVVGNYNAVSFAMELNQGLPESDNGQTAIFSNWTSTTTDFRSFDETGEIVNTDTYYPTLTISNFGFGMVSSLLVGDMPVLRNSLTIDQNQTMTVLPSDKENDERNFLNLTAGFANLSENGFYDYSTIQTQSITGENKADTDMIGWLNNPYFSSLYDAAAQDSLFSARVDTGLVFKLSKQGATYRRDELREKVNRFTFNAFSEHAKTDRDSSTDDGFSTASLKGKRYGVVTLTQKFTAQTNAKPAVTASGSITQWQDATGAGTFNESRLVATADQADIFKTWIVNETTGSPSQPDLTVYPEYALQESRDYDRLPTILFHKDTKHYTANTGRLGVDPADETWAWEGMSDVNGNLLSFAINSPDQGQGIAHAVKLQTSGTLSLDAVNTVYRLEGNGIGFSGEDNYLYHIDNSSLTFGNSQHVTLDLKRVKVSQDRNTLEVSDLTNEEPETLTGTATFGTGDIKNSVKMEFVDGDHQPVLTLEGFITETNKDGGDRTMILLLRHNNSIGLVYAMREKTR